MVLDGESDGEYLNLEGQIELIKKAENSYTNSDRWLTLIGRNGEYASIHHPYLDLAGAAGERVLMRALKPSHFSQGQMDDLSNQVETIMEPGGTITFDLEQNIDSLRYMWEYLPFQERSKISKEAWEYQLIEYVGDTLKVMDKALNLQDYDDDLIGMTDEELLNLSAFSQALLFAKAGGLETVDVFLDKLTQGYVIYPGD